jgi:hypothetical protein
VLTLELLEDRTVPSFLAPQDLYVGEGPEGVVAANFSGTGNLDLVAVNGYTRPDGAGVVLLKGNGDGTFQPPIPLDGGRHGAVVTGDFDGDGTPDLAYTTLTPSDGWNVSVLLGNGDGTFRQLPDFAGAGPWLTAADLTGNGIIDLVNDTTVYLGNGDGTFRVGSHIEGTGVHTAVADLRGNGRRDLVTVLSDAGVGLVYLSNGDGTFQLPSSFGVPLSGRDALAVGDFNGDGKIDVAVGGVNHVRILLGNGDGTFRTGPNYTTPSSTTSLAAADLTGNGILDLIAGGNVLLGNGDGTFKPAQDCYVGSYTSDVAVGDFTGNGRLDFVTANVGGATLDVRLNNGDGTFVRAPHYGPTDTLYRSIATADVNGDGNLDLVTTRGVMLGNGDGTFQDSVPFNVPSEPLAVAVLNGGRRLAVGRHDGVSILEHVSGASFQVVANYAVPGGTVNGFMHIAVADLTGNGIEDLVATDMRGVNVFLGNPDGSFTLVSRPRTGYVYVSSVAVADFDGDGIPDLVVGHGDLIDGYGVGRVMVFDGNGDGTFKDPVEYDLRNNGNPGATPIDVVAADFRGIGRPDVAVLDAWGGQVDMLLNQADGTFQFGPAIRITGGLEASSLVVADFNNDGIPDLAAAGDNGVGVLIGRGDGTFQTMLHYGATGLPFALAAGDFNGDGYTDLAVAGEHGGVAILLNAADWRPRGPIGPPLGLSPAAPLASFAGVLSGMVKPTVFEPGITESQASDTNLAHPLPLPSIQVDDGTPTLGEDGSAPHSLMPGDALEPSDHPEATTLLQPQTGDILWEGAALQGPDALLFRG